MKQNKHKWPKEADSPNFFNKLATAEFGKPTGKGFAYRPRKKKREVVKV